MSVARNARQRPGGRSKDGIAFGLPFRLESGLTMCMCVSAGNLMAVNLVDEIDTWHAAGRWRGSYMADGGSD